jgi:pyruvate/2-oxoglutarate dehydrogenase complex dihydrolipoamide acyltransferase (E2) component
MRKDGKRIKDIDTMHRIMPYIMSKRYDAMNMVTVDIPLSPLRKYINLKRHENISISNMALILTAYLRTVTKFPQLNRFIINKRIFDRNEIAVSMVVVKPNEEQSSISKLYLEKTDSLFDVEEKIKHFITQNRSSNDKNKTDELMKKMLRVPGSLGTLVNVFKAMDFFGLLPKPIIDASPFHAALLISNLASIRANHIYHHLYNFGTTSMTLTIGNTREVPRRTGNKVIFERCLPLGIVVDDRICEGDYYARAFHCMRKYLADPAMLEKPPV